MAVHYATLIVHVPLTLRSCEIEDGRVISIMEQNCNNSLGE